MSTREQIRMECSELKSFYEQKILHAFPYDDVYAAVKWGGNEFKDLSPDLSWHHTKIAGWCSWGTKMLTWDGEQKASAKNHCSKSFFEAQPRYMRLRDALGKFPVLKQDMELYEIARMRVLELLKRIEELPVGGAASQ